MMRAALSIAVLLGLVHEAGAVPSTMSFTARLTDTSGEPIDGRVDVTFRVFDQVTAGNLLWEEVQTGIAADAGLLYAELGGVDPSTNGLDASVFDGGARFLEVIVDGDTLGPRLPLLSVPYAITAGQAAALGQLTEDQVQVRVAGSCPAGQSIRAVAADGTVTCEVDDVGPTITVGTGLTAAVTPTNVTLSVNTTVIQARVAGSCPAGQSIRAVAVDGTVTCEVDDVGSRIIVGSGLTGASSPTGEVTLSVNTTAIQSRVVGTCAAGSSIRGINNDGSVVCEPDDNSGGDITGVTAGTGLAGGGVTGDVTVSLAIGGVTTEHILDGTIAAADIGPNQVRMDKTSAPIGSAHVRASFTSNVQLIYATPSFTADSSGECLVTASLWASTGQTSGHFLLRVAASDNGVNLFTGLDVTGDNPITAHLATPIWENNQYQWQGSVTHVIPVGAGRSYRFGCVVGRRVDATPAYACQTSYVCQ
jgi:hypothetical protein